MSHYGFPTVREIKYSLLRYIPRLYKTMDKNGLTSRMLFSKLYKIMVSKVTFLGFRGIEAIAPLPIRPCNNLSLLSILALLLCGVCDMNISSWLDSWFRWTANANQVLWLCQFDFPQCALQSSRQLVEELSISVFASYRTLFFLSKLKVNLLFARIQLESYLIQPSENHVPTDWLVVCFKCVA